VRRDVIDAIRYCARPGHLRRTVPIALVVGLVLTTVNQLDVIVSASWTERRRGGRADEGKPMARLPILEVRPRCLAFTPSMTGAQQTEATTTRGLAGPGRAWPVSDPWNALAPKPARVSMRSSSAAE
jgi:hypothetical protein